jgi:hypothetical protein
MEVAGSDSRVKGRLWLLMNFPWDVFEAMISSSLRRLKLHQQIPQYTAQFTPMWEKLEQIAERYEALSQEMSKPEVAGDLEQIAQYGREKRVVLAGR